MPAGSYVLRLLTSRTAAERSGLDKGRFTRVMQVGAQKRQRFSIPLFHTFACAVRQTIPSSAPRPLLPCLPFCVSRVFSAFLFLLTMTSPSETHTEIYF